MAGLFDAKIFDFLRGDEGDLKAAQDRATAAARKLARNKADVEAIQQNSRKLNGGTVVGKNAAGTPAVSVDLASNQLIQDQATQLSDLAARVAEQAELVEELSRAQDDIIRHTKQMKKKMLEIVESVDAKRESTENVMSFFGDTTLAIANAFVKVINVGDTVQNHALLAIAAAMEAAVQSDKYEEQENWLLLGALLANTLAHYDPAIGISSAFTNGSGSIVPQLTTTPTTPAPTGATGGFVRAA